MSRIRVPLSVDAQVGVDIGAVRVPYRALGTLGAAIPVGLLVLHLGLPFGVGLTLASLVAVGAMAVAVPDREGIWIVSYWLGRRAHGVMPNQREGGTWSRGPIDVVERGTVSRAASRPPARIRGPLARWVDAPRVVDAADGMLCLDPGGWRAVLRLDGPPAAPESSAYRTWCEAATRWLLALECPAQLVTEVCHLDRAEAERAWEGASCFRPADGPLALHERVFAGDMAQHSLAFTHHVALAPRSVGRDGIPHACSVLRGRHAERASRTDAERVLEAAVHRAEERGLGASPVTAGADLRHLLRETVLGEGPAAVIPQGVWVDGVHLGLLGVTGLPPDVDFGVCVRAVQRAGIRGTVSLHVLPASPDAVRTALRQQRALLRRILEQRREEEDVAVALEDVRRLQADIAAGNVIGLRMALGVAVKARLRSECAMATERMAKLLEGEGFTVVRPTVPGLRPVMSVAPGLPPLRRALHLTTDAVVARLLPVLATPFSDASAPIVGRNLRTGSTAHLSLWSRSNSNALVVGSSGSGKSVALKVWPLVRHHVQGANAVVIDPESEFEPVIRLLGGR
ncbi:MAG TPA: type IV secretory system conjugative DNA transfer family protein, partial [Candidatus Dormibacteraeota bacterium]|nr:type IV secretory system conjugative DNA transfer family protein [Candidatus Dormibacteraeota bacterium]